MWHTHLFWKIELSIKVASGICNLISLIATVLLLALSKVIDITLSLILYSSSFSKINVLILVPLCGHSSVLKLIIRLLTIHFASMLCAVIPRKVLSLLDFHNYVVIAILSGLSAN